MFSIFNQKSKNKNQKLFIGLGNPGAKYQNNRHNFGFMAVEEIASRLKASEWSEKFGGLVSRLQIAYPELVSGSIRRDPEMNSGSANEIILFKPMDFMNNSGIAASKIANFYKIAPENIYVFYDELDLTIGKIKIKQGGGDGGHNGIKSLDAHMGKDYWRVRLGIGHPGHKDLVHSHVLNDFNAEERPQAEKCIKTIAENIGVLINGDTNLFLTRYSESFDPKPRQVKENPKQEKEA